MSDTYLNKIIEKTIQEVNSKKNSSDLNDIKLKIKDLPDCLPFVSTLEIKIKNKESAIIAELKKASPSKGIIRKNYNLKEIAKSYERAGADCLSVLTNETFFSGKLSHIKDVRGQVSLPILRKDFIVDEFQVYESRDALADCILLIVSALSKTQLEDYYKLAKTLGLDVLVEVHSETELDVALEINADLIGINNRDLKTFEVNLEVSKDLKNISPENTLLVSESGITSKNDITYLTNQGIYAYLVGEVFMKEEDPGSKLKEFFGK